jgi:hypothetical protein
MAGDMVMRVPWSHREQAPVNPSEPHEFQRIRDVGLATGLARLYQPGGGGISDIAMTNNYLRKSRCGVPGCGKDRYDPIHAPGE